MKFLLSCFCAIVQMHFLYWFFQINFVLFKNDETKHSCCLFFFYQQLLKRLSIERKLSIKIIMNCNSDDDSKQKRESMVIKKSVDEPKSHYKIEQIDLISEQIIKSPVVLNTIWPINCYNNKSKCICCTYMYRIYVEKAKQSVAKQSLI